MRVTWTLIAARISKGSGGSAGAEVVREREVARARRVGAKDFIVKVCVVLIKD